MHELPNHASRQSQQWLSHFSPSSNIAVCWGPVEDLIDANPAELAATLARFVETGGQIEASKHDNDTPLKDINDRLDQLRSFRSRRTPFLFCNNSSGTGKTQLAFALGQRVVYVPRWLDEWGRAQKIYRCFQGLATSLLDATLVDQANSDEGLLPADYVPCQTLGLLAAAMERILYFEQPSAGGKRHGSDSPFRGPACLAGTLKGSAGFMSLSQFQKMVETKFDKFVVFSTNTRPNPPVTARSSCDVCCAQLMASLLLLPEPTLLQPT